MRRFEYVWSYDIDAQQSVHLTLGILRRFQALRVARSGFRQNDVLSSRPPASNASRWAASMTYVAEAI
jgi:hypothetical protein